MVCALGGQCNSSVLRTEEVYSNESNAPMLGSSVGDIISIFHPHHEPEHHPESDDDSPSAPPVERKYCDFRAGTDSPKR